MDDLLTKQFPCGVVCLAIFLPSAGRVTADEMSEGVSEDVVRMMYADTTSGRPFSKDPAVVSFGDRYLLYYSCRAEKTWAIGIAESRDLVHWERVGRLEAGAPYEAKGICAPGALVIRGKVHLFYQRYGYGAQDAICHAFSSDGVRFERNPTNPIFHPTGEWNNGRAIDADVIEFEGRLLLYFATRDTGGKAQMLGVAGAPIDSDFGRSSWTQLCDASILKPELPWERRCIEAPALCLHEDKLYMFYAGAYNNEPQQVGCAVSDDGVQWRRLSDTPFLPNGKPGEWNSSESGHPYLFEDDDGRMYLFYQGNNKGKSWYLSQIGIGWLDGLPRNLGPATK